jgi:hypothetical protein
MAMEAYTIFERIAVASELIVSRVSVGVDCCVYALTIAPTGVRESRFQTANLRSDRDGMRRGNDMSLVPLQHFSLLQLRGGYSCLMTAIPFFFRYT